LTAPLLNGFSRLIERDADRFALERTRAPQVFVSMIRKLGEMNLADFTPGLLTELFLYDHPPIAKRISFAQQFQFD
jgi:STE24 endopeptidase